MEADQALELMRRLLWTTFEVSAPILFAALIVGLPKGQFYNRPQVCKHP